MWGIHVEPKGFFKNAPLSKQYSIYLSNYLTQLREHQVVRFSQPENKIFRRELYGSAVDKEKFLGSSPPEVG